MKKRCTIGVIIGNANSPHAKNIIAGINRAAEENGVNLLYFVNVRSTYVDQLYYENGSVPISQQFNPIYEYAEYTRADVLIMTYGTMRIFMEENQQSSYLERFRQRPCVLLEEEAHWPGWSSIVIDNYQGMYQLVEHLVKEHGYRKLAYLSGPKENTDAMQRKQAFEDVLQRYGCEIDADHVEYGDYSEYAERQVNRLLDRFPDLEAIVCANDLMAYTAYRECEKRGLRIGKDIAITGYDDWERVRYLDAPMTTVLQDSTEMGYQAVQRAIALYQGEAGSSSLLPTKIKIRESCGCCQRQLSDRETSRWMARHYLKSTEARSKYIEKAWLVPLISRELISGIDEYAVFFRSVLRSLPAFNVKSSYFFVMDEPISCENAQSVVLPEKMYLAASQHGAEVQVYEVGSRPIITRQTGFSSVISNEESYNLSIFCLLSGSLQYGILAAQIQPEDVDLLHLISSQMANALMIYRMEQNRRQALCERDQLLAELREKNEVLNFISEYDQMTSVYNRRGLMEGVMQLNQKHIGKKAVFVFADLDHLKEINDCFGHNEGDFAICKVAEILKGAVRESDVCGRLSGDEFVLMLIGDAHVAEMVIARVHKQCDAFNQQSDKRYNIRVSMGFEEIVCSEELLVTEILKKADQAMYAEKAGRRGSAKKNKE